ncbi:MAG: cobyrinic acid a,c-diamide synthase [Burkholderiales bacterium]|nr:cobyrinic acid a,c-diamide synthase [Burkholderiales bacterium]
MSAKIIVLTNQKGGCGKTTLTMNIAGVIGQKKKVLIIDGDSQGSATRWASSASDNKPFPTAIMGLANVGDKVHREIKKYVANYEYIFVDCPPAIDNPFTASALLVANLALVPVIPSPTDLWAAVGIQKVISNVSTLNENLQARLIANMCQNNVSISKEALTLIDEFLFPKMNTNVHQRTAYRQAAAFGGTVADLDNPKAKAEIDQLIKEILKII